MDYVELAQFETYSTWVEMILVIIFLVVTLVQACKHFRFIFIFYMLIMLIASDLLCAATASWLSIETLGKYKMKKETFSCIMGIFTAFFTWTQCMFHWFFAFKYWVTAYEVSRFFKLKDGKLVSREKIYTYVNWFILAYCTIFCTALGYERAMLSQYGEEPNKKFTNVGRVTFLYHFTYSV